MWWIRSSTLAGGQAVSIVCQRPPYSLHSSGGQVLELAPGKSSAVSSRRAAPGIMENFIKINELSEISDVVSTLSRDFRGLE